jgi:hypothetical protein
MILRATILVAALGLPFAASPARATDWQTSPNRWENSSGNWLNSPQRWENSPANWLNSPNRYGNDRILRDADGMPKGYIVPKQDGGANIFDFQGNRRGYLPAR